MTTAPPLVRPSKIPGPSGHPLLGMAPALRRDMLGTLLDGFHRYGDLVAYLFGPRWGPRRLRVRTVAVHHPDGVRQVLTDTAVFIRRAVAFEVLTEMIGTGLLTSDGDVWLRQRRTLQPLFTPRRVAGYARLMADEAARVAQECAVGSGSAVDLHELMQRYTLRVVGRALFGDDVADALPALRRLMPLTGDLALRRTMQLARPPLRWPTPRNRRIVRARAEQYHIVDRILARRAARRGPGDDGDDLLSRLHAARDPVTGQPLSPQEIRDQALVFLLAGHETTAAALTFTLHLLGRNPEVQDHVATAARAKPDDPIGVSDLCWAAVQEGMRLFPPAYGTERLVNAETEIAGYPVPVGTAVLVSSWVTHRHPEFWPDPARFDPGRFVGEHDRPRYAYFPFGGGPRSCIGEHFARLEATVLLRTLLARHRVESLDPQLRLAPLISLRPATPVLATLSAR
jgi:cytochrome P450